jgi:catalase
MDVTKDEKEDLQPRIRAKAIELAKRAGYDVERDAQGRPVKFEDQAGIYDLYMAEAHRFFAREDAPEAP